MTGEEEDSLIESVMSAVKRGVPEEELRGVVSDAVNGAFESAHSVGYQLGYKDGMAGLDGDGTSPVARQAEVLIEQMQAALDEFKGAIEDA